MNNYVLSQIIVIIAAIFMGITYIINNKTTIMLLCIVYCILYGIHYLLLNALSGCVINSISITRNLLFFINAKRKKKNSILVLLILVLITITSSIYFYKNAYSLMLMIASLISTYSIWQDSIKTYRVLSIPVSICYIVYAFYINSLLSIFIEILLLICEIVGLINLQLAKQNN